LAISKGDISGPAACSWALLARPSQLKPPVGPWSWLSSPSLS
jgi:hypothetical protein